MSFSLSRVFVFFVPFVFFFSTRVCLFCPVSVFFVLVLFFLSRYRDPTQKKWGPKGWGPEGWEAQNFAFFPFPPQFSFFLPSLGLLRGIFVVFEAPWS